MKNLTKRVVSLFLTLAMLMPLVCVYPFALSASDMADYSEEHWAAEALEWAVEYDLIKGYEDGTIRPDANLTRAEMATVINRAFGATILADVSKFVDIDINDWFYEEAAKAVNMGTFEGNEHKEFLPNDFIRREEAFVVIARALVLAGGKVAELERFGDSEKVSDWAKELLADLAGRKYINGSPVENQEKNNLYPRENITRAEFAQLLHNIFLEIVNVTPVKGTTYEGNILVNYNQGSLVIENVVVKGDLVIADGVALNKVTLKNVTVEGRLVIRGGKDVKLTNVTTKGGVVVSNNNTTVNFDNYKTEDVFEGVILKTPATFKKHSSSGGSIVVGPTVTTAAYKVEYYLEELDGTYAKGGEYTYNGKIGTVIDGKSNAYKYHEKAFTGFTFDAANANNVTSGTVVSNGSLVLKFYYTRNEYDVTFEYNGGTDANSATSAIVKVKYQATKDYINYPAVTREGYDFNGWYDQAAGGNRFDTDNVKFDENGATTFYAQWVAKGDTPYKLVIRYQNVADDNYDDFEEFTLEGTTDTDVTIADAVNTAIAKEGYAIPTGFELVNGGDTDTILADGTLEIIAYFDRIETTVIFDYDGGKDASDNTSSSVILRYGAALVLPTGITKAGYVANGWYNAKDDSPAPAIYNEVEDTTYYIDWLEGDTTYILNIYIMDVEGNYPATPTETRVIDAISGDTVEVEDQVLENGGLLIDTSMPNVLEATVKGDGTTTLVAYYKRATYKVTFAKPDGDAEKTVLYGATLDESDFEWVYNPNNIYSLYDNSKLYEHMEGLERGVKNVGWVEVIDGDNEIYGDEYFTPETVVTADIVLAPEWKLLVLKADWTNSSLDFTIGANNSKFQTIEAVYNDNTRAIDTAKDILISKSTTVNEIIKKMEDKGYDDKAFGKLDMILDENRNIRHFEFDINTVEVLGEENLENEISEALHVADTDPKHDTIVAVVDELLATGTVVIDDDNYDVMVEFKKQVELLDYENDIKSHIPDVYSKFMSEESIIESYEQAKQQILTNIQEALDHHVAGSTDKVDLTAITDVVIKTDLVGDLLIPKFDVAKDKFVSKYEAKVGDSLTPEMQRILDIISPKALLNHDDAHVSYEDGLSGYSLKENKFYYDVIQRLAVLGDEAGKALQAKAEEKGLDAEEIADAFADFAFDYMNTINDYLDKYVDELIEKGYDALNKSEIDLVEKYRDRRLTAEDIEKAKKALKKVINGYDTTTDDAFDLAVEAANKAMEKDKIENAVDKYTQSITITDAELGATAKNITVTLTRTRKVLY